jgi:hypothetical protein
MKAFVVCALVSAFAVGNASTVFWGGDPNLVNGLISGRNLASAGEGHTFDDFTLSSAQNVNGIFGDFFVASSYTTNFFTQAYYEIRQNVDLTGGTLIASGTASASAVNTGMSGFGLSIFQISATGLNVNLGAGTYSVALAPVGNGTGSIYVTTTGGANGIGAPLANGNSFFHAISFYTGSPGWYSTTDPAFALGAGTWDFSYGISANPVPEPASMAVLGIGALALLRRRKKA